MVVHARKGALDHELCPMGKGPLAHAHCVDDRTEQDRNQTGGEKRHDRHQRRHHQEVDCRVWAILACGNRLEIGDDRIEDIETSQHQWHRQIGNLGPRTVIARTHRLLLAAVERPRQ